MASGQRLVRGAWIRQTSRNDPWWIILLDSSARKGHILHCDVYDRPLFGIHSTMSKASGSCLHDPCWLPVLSSAESR